MTTYESVKHEFKALMALAIPTMIGMYSFFAFSLTELIVTGHLGVDQLAGTAYSQTAIDMSILVLVNGFCVGLNSLCSQAYGAKNYSLVGQYAQLATFISVIMVIPIAFFLLCLPDLLGWAGASTGVVYYSRSYCHIWILCLWPRVVYRVLEVYFQSQQIVIPTMIITASSVLVNLFLAVGLTFGRFGLPELGFIGCPLATFIAMSLRLTVYVYYMFIFKNYNKKCPWQRNWNFLDMKIFKYLAEVSLPLAIGTLLENLQLLMIMLMASSLGEVALGAHNSIMELFFFASSPIYALINTAVTRIGRHLGANKPDLAREVALIGGACLLLIGIMNTTWFLLGRESIGRLFSTNEEVISAFRQIVGLSAYAYAILIFFYYAVMVLQAQARTIPVMVAFVVGAWCVSVPCAYILGLTRSMGRGLIGIWIGMLMGYVLTSSIGFYSAVWGTNWTKEADNAVKRSKLKVQKEIERQKFLLGEKAMLLPK